MVMKFFLLTTLFAFFSATRANESVKPAHSSKIVGNGQQAMTIVKKDSPQDLIKRLHQELEKLTPAEEIVDTVTVKNAGILKSPQEKKAQSLMNEIESESTPQLFEFPSKIKKKPRMRRVR